MTSWRVRTYHTLEGKASKTESRQRGRGSMRRAAARGRMSEHRACCVDLIKFTSVLFAVGLVTQLYLYSAHCCVRTTDLWQDGDYSLGEKKDNHVLLVRLAPLDSSLLKIFTRC